MTRHLTRLSLFALLVCLVAACIIPTHAFADVRKGDVVLGHTVESQGLTVADCPDIIAERAIVTDANGNVFFERNADDHVQVASITKIMTAVTALDSVPVDTVISVSENAAWIGESSSWLLPGDTMVLSEALKALLVPSGNDAAQAIAETIGGMMLQSEGKDSQDLDACCNRFVEAMNTKAAELGMANTHWTNPHGLDDGEFESDQHSCARDIATLSAYAMTKQAIRDIVGMDTASAQIDREGYGVTADYESTDLLLGDYEGACGIKTGFTNLAGACFAGACNRGEDIYAIALGSTDEWQRFEDVMAMWDWYYAHRVDVPLCTSNEYTTDSSGNTVPLVAKVPAKAWIEETVDATLENTDATVRVFDILGNVSQDVEYYDLDGAIHAGDVVGVITYKQRNEVVTTANMVAAQDKPAPNLFQAVSIWWNKFISGFFGDDRLAEPQLYNQMPLINSKSA